MCDLKNIPCFFACLQFAILWNSSRQTLLKILNKALTLATLPLLSVLSHSCLGLSYSIDLSWASRINGGPYPYSIEFHTLSPCILRKNICSILLPWEGHRDEISYLEAFIMDSILTGRWIHVGYLMMMHMISCIESTTQVLPYGHFLTRVFKDVNVYLSRKTDFEAPTSYDTYDEQSLGRMKFEKAPDGSWIRRAERQARD